MACSGSRVSSSYARMLWKQKPCQAQCQESVLHITECLVPKGYSSCNRTLALLSLFHESFGCTTYASNIELDWPYDYLYKCLITTLETDALNITGVTMQVFYINHNLSPYLTVAYIGQGERPPRGQLWMEQCLTSLKYWPIQYTIWADPNYTWGLAILADSLLFSVNNILAGLWINCISSVEITLFLLADILLQHRALFQC